MWSSTEMRSRSGPNRLLWGQRDVRDDERVYLGTSHVSRRPSISTSANTSTSTTTVDTVARIEGIERRLLQCREHVHRASSVSQSDAYHDDNSPTGAQNSYSSSILLSSPLKTNTYRSNNFNNNETFNHQTVALDSRMEASRRSANGNSHTNASTSYTIASGGGIYKDEALNNVRSRGMRSTRNNANATEQRDNDHDADRRSFYQTSNGGDGESSAARSSTIQPPPATVPLLNRLEALVSKLESHASSSSATSPLPVALATEKRGASTTLGLLGGRDSEREDHSSFAIVRDSALNNSRWLRGGGGESVNEGRRTTANGDSILVVGNQYNTISRGANDSEQDSESTSAIRRRAERLLADDGTAARANATARSRGGKGYTSYSQQRSRSSRRNEGTVAGGKEGRIILSSSGTTQFPSSSSGSKPSSGSSTSSLTSSFAASLPLTKTTSTAPPYFLTTPAATPTTAAALIGGESWRSHLERYGELLLQQSFSAKRDLLLNNSKENHSTNSEHNNNNRNYLSPAIKLGAKGGRGTVWENEKEKGQKPAVRGGSASTHTTSTRKRAVREELLGTSEVVRGETEKRTTKTRSDSHSSSEGKSLRRKGAHRERPSFYSSRSSSLASPFSVRGVGTDKHQIGRARGEESTRSGSSSSEDDTSFYASSDGTNPPTTTVPLPPPLPSYSDAYIAEPPRDHSTFHGAIHATSKNSSSPSHLVEKANAPPTLTSQQEEGSNNKVHVRGGARARTTSDKPSHRRQDFISSHSSFSPTSGARPPQLASQKVSRSPPPNSVRPTPPSSSFVQTRLNILLSEQKDLLSRLENQSPALQKLIALETERRKAERDAEKRRNDLETQLKLEREREQKDALVRQQELQRQQLEIAERERERQREERERMATEEDFERTRRVREGEEERATILKWEKEWRNETEESCARRRVEEKEKLKEKEEMEKMEEMARLAEIAGPTQQSHHQGHISSDGREKRDVAGKKKAMVKKSDASDTRDTDSSRTCTSSEDESFFGSDLSETDSFPSASRQKTSREANKKKRRANERRREHDEERGGAQKRSIRRRIRQGGERSEQEHFIIHRDVHVEKSEWNRRVDEHIEEEDDRLHAADYYDVQHSPAEDARGNLTVGLAMPQGPFIRSVAAAATDPSPNKRDELGRGVNGVGGLGVARRSAFSDDDRTHTTNSFITRIHLAAGHTTNHSSSGISSYKHHHLFQSSSAGEEVPMMMMNTNTNPTMAAALRSFVSEGEHENNNADNGNDGNQKTTRGADDSRSQQAAVLTAALELTTKVLAQQHEERQQQQQQRQNKHQQEEEPSIIPRTQQSKKNPNVTKSKRNKHKLGKDSSADGSLSTTSSSSLSSSSLSPTPSLNSISSSPEERKSHSIAEKKDKRMRRTTKTQLPNHRKGRDSEEDRRQKPTLASIDQGSQLMKVNRDPSNPPEHEPTIINSLFPLPLPPSSVAVGVPPDIASFSSSSHIPPPPLSLSPQQSLPLLPLLEKVIEAAAVDAERRSARDHEVLRQALDLAREATAESFSAVSNAAMAAISNVSAAVAAASSSSLAMQHHFSMHPPPHPLSSSSTSSSPSEEGEEEETFSENDLRHVVDRGNRAQSTSHEAVVGTAAEEVTAKKIEGTPQERATTQQRNKSSSSPSEYGLGGEGGVVKREEEKEEEELTATTTKTKSEISHHSPQSITTTTTTTTKQVNATSNYHSNSSNGAMMLDPFSQSPTTTKGSLLLLPLTSSVGVNTEEDERKASSVPRVEKEAKIDKEEATVDMQTSAMARTGGEPLSSLIKETTNSSGSRRSTAAFDNYSSSIIAGGNRNDVDNNNNNRDNRNTRTIIDQMMSGRRGATPQLQTNKVWDWRREHPNFYSSPSSSAPSFVSVSDPSSFLSSASAAALLLHSSRSVSSPKRGATPTTTMRGGGGGGVDHQQTTTRLAATPTRGMNRQEHEREREERPVSVFLEAASHFYHKQEESDDHHQKEQQRHVLAHDREGRERIERDNSIQELALATPAASAATSNRKRATATLSTVDGQPQRILENNTRTRTTNAVPTPIPPPLLAASGPATIPTGIPIPHERHDSSPGGADLPSSRHLRASPSASTTLPTTPAASPLLPSVATQSFAIRELEKSAETIVANTVRIAAERSLVEAERVLQDRLAAVENVRKREEEALERHLSSQRQHYEEQLAAVLAVQREQKKALEEALSAAGKRGGARGSDGDNYNIRQWHQTPTNTDTSSRSTTTIAESEVIRRGERERRKEESDENKKEVQHNNVHRHSSIDSTAATYSHNTNKTTMTPSSASVGTLLGSSTVALLQDNRNRSINDVDVSVEAPTGRAGKDPRGQQWEKEKEEATRGDRKGKEKGADEVRERSEGVLIHAEKKSRDHLDYYSEREKALKTQLEKMQKMNKEHELKLLQRQRPRAASSHASTTSTSLLSNSKDTANRRTSDTLSRSRAAGSAAINSTPPWQTTLPQRSRSSGAAAERVVGTSRDTTSATSTSASTTMSNWVTLCSRNVKMLASANSRKIVNDKTKKDHHGASSGGTRRSRSALKATKERGLNPPSSRPLSQSPTRKVAGSVDEDHHTNNNRDRPVDPQAIATVVAENLIRRHNAEVEKLRKIKNRKYGELGGEGGGGAGYASAESHISAVIRDPRAAGGAAGFIIDPKIKGAHLANVSDLSFVSKITSDSHTKPRSKPDGGDVRSEDEALSLFYAAEVRPNIDGGSRGNNNSGNDEQRSRASGRRAAAASSPERPSKLGREPIPMGIITTKNERVGSSSPMPLAATLAPSRRHWDYISLHHDPRDKDSKDLFDRPDISPIRRRAEMGRHSSREEGAREEPIDKDKAKEGSPYNDDRYSIVRGSLISPRRPLLDYNHNDKVVGESGAAAQGGDGPPSLSSSSPSASRSPSASLLIPPIPNHQLPTASFLEQSNLKYQVECLAIHKLSEMMSAMETDREGGEASGLVSSVERAVEGSAADNRARSTGHGNGESNRTNLSSPSPSRRDTNSRREDVSSSHVSSAAIFGANAHASASGGGGGLLNMRSPHRHRKCEDPICGKFGFR